MGADVFAGHQPSREAIVLRTRQVLLNLDLRLRERFAMDAGRPDRLLRALEDSTGPARSCAAAIRELGGAADGGGKESLAVLAAAAPKWSDEPRRDRCRRSDCRRLLRRARQAGPRAEDAGAVDNPRGARSASTHSPN